MLRLATADRAGYDITFDPPAWFLAWQLAALAAAGALAVTLFAAGRPAEEHAA